MKSCSRVAMFVALALFGPLSASAANIESVRELMKVMNSQKMLQDILPSMSGIIVNSLKQGHPDLPPDVPDIVAKVVSDSISPLIPEMIKASEKLYADSLTEEEVTGAIAFYKTPAGQGILKKMPMIVQQGMQNGQTIVQAHIPEIQQRLKEELQKRHPEIK